MRQYVRIVAGRFKGRRLKVIDQKALRPTSARIRETLFNWVGGDLTQMHVLDLFAGSGALGFEALSRGASHVTFVEKQNRTASQIKETCRRLDLTGAEAQVVCRNCLSWIKQDTQLWDLVFVDPPFGTLDVYEKIFSSIQPRLRTDGLVYVEQSKRITINSQPFTLWKEATVGEVRFSLLTLNDR